MSPAAVSWAVSWRIEVARAVLALMALAVWVLVAWTDPPAAVPCECSSDGECEVWCG